MAITAMGQTQVTPRRKTPPSGADVGAPFAGAAKAAELASGLGAIVLGAGLALVLPDWLRRYALPLLIGGALVHGVGMTLKHRLESRNRPTLWWEQVLFWGCWLCLVGLGLWIAAAAVT